jgi:hypothetical protein
MRLDGKDVCMVGFKQLRVVDNLYHTRLFIKGEVASRGTVLITDSDYEILNHQIGYVGAAADDGYTIICFEMLPAVGGGGIG